jgi:BolA protein
MLVELIKDRLADLDPSEIDVFDDSAAHAGHAGVRETGGGHFELFIVSSRFEGLMTVKRHRMIYDKLSDLMPHQIHALSIRALTPSEID